MDISNGANQVIIGENGEIHVINGSNEIHIGGNGSVEINNGSNVVQSHSYTYTETNETVEEQIKVEPAQSKEQQDFYMGILLFGLVLAMAIGVFINFINWGAIKEYFCRKFGISNKK